MELNKIYNEDCLITMSNMPDNYIDFVITSPPYDNLRKYNGYEFNFEEIAKELFRVLKAGGVVIWNVADATIDGSETGTSFRQALFFKEIGFRLHDTMIFCKNNPIPQASSSKRYNQKFEYLFAFSKGSPSTFNPIKVLAKAPAKRKSGVATFVRRGHDGALHRSKRGERVDETKVGNIFSYPVGGISTKDEIAFQHPAVFPEKLVRDQIYTWTNENDLVYDPFMGSGTTAKVAHMMNRRWLGSEVSKEYVDLANKRLQQYIEADIFRQT